LSELQELNASLINQVRSTDTLKKWMSTRSSALLITLFIQIIRNQDCETVSLRNEQLAHAETRNQLEFARSSVEQLTSVVHSLQHQLFTALTQKQFQDTLPSKELDVDTEQPTPTEHESLQTPCTFHSSKAEFETVIRPTIQALNTRDNVATETIVEPEGRAPLQLDLNIVDPYGNSNSPLATVQPKQSICMPDSVHSTQPLVGLHFAGSNHLPNDIQTQKHFLHSFKSFFQEQKLPVVQHVISYPDFGALDSSLAALDVSVSLSDASVCSPGGQPRHVHPPTHGVVGQPNLSLISFDQEHNWVYLQPGTPMNSLTVFSNAALASPGLACIPEDGGSPVSDCSTPTISHTRSQCDSDIGTCIDIFPPALGCSPDADTNDGIVGSLTLFTRLPDGISTLCYTTQTISSFSERRDCSPLRTLNPRRTIKQRPMTHVESTVCCLSPGRPTTNQITDTNMRCETSSAIPFVRATFLQQG
jgi:hypothetical protein